MMLFSLQTLTLPISSAVFSPKWFSRGDALLNIPISLVSCTRHPPPPIERELWEGSCLSALLLLPLHPPPNRAWHPQQAFHI